MHKLVPFYGRKLAQVEKIFVPLQSQRNTRTSLQADAERFGAVGDNGGGCGVEDFKWSILTTLDFESGMSEIPNYH